MRLVEQNRCRVVAFAFVVCLLFSGCSKNVHVKGRVTFPDGTPLTVGTVYFTDDFVLGRSDLDKNGEYSLHTFRKNDGIPRGIYKVYITGCFYMGGGEKHESEFGDLTLENLQFAIDMQHMLPDTSGWLFDVQKNSVINLTVYPPNQVPEEARTEEAKYFFDEEYRKKVKKERGDKPPARPRLVNPKLL